MTSRALRSMLAGAFAICLLSNLFAAPQQTRQLTVRQQHILRAINLARAQLSEPALHPFPVSGNPPEAVDATSTNDSGVITGMLIGLQNPIPEPFLPSAVVVAWTADSTRGGVGFATVFPDGSYRIDGLPDGDYFVLAGADEYIPKFYDDATLFIDATPVPVVNGGTAEGIDFFMKKIPPGEGSIFGTVVDDHSGSPVANASVEAFSLKNPFRFGFAATGPDGSFRITQLRGGEYALTTYGEGYMVEFYDDAESLSDATLLKVEEPAATGPLDISLGRGGMISGSVINVDGTALANVYVEAMSKFWFGPDARPDSSFVGGWGAAVTDDSGNYLIVGLPSGEYLVRAQIQDPWLLDEKWYDDVRSPDEATPVEVLRDEESPNIDFNFSIAAANGIIAGQVTDLNNTPLQDVEILAYFVPDGTPGDAEFVAVGITDAHGNYVLNHLPNGFYLVQATLYSGLEFVQRWWPDSETRDGAELVAVDGAADPAPTDFRLPVTAATAVISGTVHQASGEILPDAWVEISPAELSPDVTAHGVWAYAFTDSAGQFFVENLPAGSYVAQAQFWQGEDFGQQWYDHIDRRQEATIIDLADGDRRDDVNFDLKLRPYFGTLAGAVKNEVTGEPIARAYVELTQLGVSLLDGPNIWPFYAVTSDSGTYQIEGLPQGEYLAAVYANGAFEYFEDALTMGLATPVAITGGEITHIDFGLSLRHDGAGRIAGQVYDEYNDGLLEIAVVTARPVAGPAVFPDSEIFYTAVIDEGGGYEITGIPAGEYYVMAFSPMHIGEYYDSVFDPAEATPVQVDSLHPATGIDFSLMPSLLETDASGRAAGATLFGKVQDNNQRGLENAAVYLLDEQGQPITSARCGRDGTYELRNVPAGVYHLRAGHPDYASSYQDGAATLAAARALQINGADVEIDFSLLPKSTTAVEQHKLVAPISARLLGNYPNPFNPETRISFSLPSEMEVNVTIFNLLGIKVRQLFRGRLQTGVHNFNWDGRNQHGEQAASGVYFTVLQTSRNQLMVKQMTLMK